VLPVTVAAVVLVCCWPCRSCSPEVRRGAAGGHEQFEHSGKFVSGETPIFFEDSYLDAKKEFLASPELTETSQPAPTAKSSAPPVKSASKPASGGATRGEVLDQVLPDVSDKARGTIHGTVRISVRAHVNRAGTVDSAELDSPSSSKYFSETMIKATEALAIFCAGSERAKRGERMAAAL